MASVKLNLGCGTRKKNGYLNIDRNIKCKPDKCWNLEEGIPCEDNTVIEVYMRDFLEHIENYINLFNEIYRVCKNNAEIRIQVPYALCDAAHDIDHKSYWVPRKFEQICDPIYDYSGINGTFELISIDKIINSDEVTFLKVKMVVRKLK